MTEIAEYRFKKNVPVLKVGKVMKFLYFKALKDKMYLGCIHY